MWLTDTGFGSDRTMSGEEEKEGNHDSSDDSDEQRTGVHR